MSLVRVIYPKKEMTLSGSVPRLTVFEERWISRKSKGLTPQRVLFLKDLAPMANRVEHKDLRDSGAEYQRGNKCDCPYATNNGPENTGIIITEP